MCLSRLFHCVLLVATASMAGLLVSPAAAYADGTTTTLTKAEMLTALKRVTATTNAVARAGWRAKTVTTGDITSTYVVDPVGGRDRVQWNLAGLAGNEYSAQGRGVYTYLSDAESLAAVKVMARPSARYAFHADKTQALADLAKDTGLTNLMGVLAAQNHPGTKTVNDDGSTDYAAKTDGATVTLHVTAAGALTSVKAGSPASGYATTYTYGRQTITLPAASVTVDQATLNKAKVYVAMAADVRTAATNGAAHALTAAKHKTVNVAALRQIVRTDVTAVNQSVCLTIVKTINIKNGIKEGYSARL